MNQASPTNVRYIVVAATALMSVLLYLDRFCISVAEIYIKEDLGLTDVQIGWVMGAFFYTYAFGQVPAGWLTDRFGSRIMLTCYILLWSLFTGLIGAAAALSALLLLRFGFGFAQAGAYPTGASIISKWVPFNARGTASGIVSVGGRVGGWLTLFLTGYVIVWLTPASTPATLSKGDLLDPVLLCRELTGEGEEVDEPVRLGRAKVLNRLTPESQTFVGETAEAYKAAVAERERRLAEEGEKASDAVQLPTLTASEVDRLSAAMNEVIMQRDFFTAADTRELSVEKEAERLLARPSELDDGQSAKLNRLVIEALHRNSVRKIYGRGWRPMMFTYASLGLLVAGVFWWCTRVRPSEHPWCNTAEVDLIEGDSRVTTAGKVGGVPIRKLLTSRSMWCVCLAQWFTNVGWIFLMTWAPRYFIAVHEVPIEQRVWMTSIPPLVGWVGMVAGGVVTDQLVKWVGLRWGRGLPMSLTRFLAMGAYLCCLLSPSPWMAVLLFSVVAFATDLGTASVWAFKQDVGGRHVGSILGWGNMWGNLGAAFMAPFLPWVIGESQRWDWAFMACAGAFFLSGVFALGVDATIPIAPDAKKGEAAD